MLSAPLPRTIEPFKFVEQRAELSGEIALSQLPRIRQSVSETDGALVLRLSFSKDEEGLDTLCGELKARLVLECQRCLEPATIDVASTFSYVLLRSESLAASVPRYYDPIVVHDSELDLWQLMEDELILSLPLVAYHPQGECAIDESYRKSDTGDKTSRVNPFSVLEDLKKPKN